MDEDTRALFREVASALDAVVVALQTEAAGATWGYGLEEAIRRVNRLRQHIEGIAAGPRR